MSQSPSLASREAGSSKPARRAVRRRPTASHFLIALAVLLAFTLNLLALQSRGDTVLVAVAGDAIPAGSRLTPEMVRMVPVASGFVGLQSLLGEPDVAALTGWVVQREIAAGGVVDRSNLAMPAGPEGLRAMSVPVPVARAAGGRILVGDRVDVVAVQEGEARYVIMGSEVLAVAQVGTGFASVDFHLVLAVDADQALLLAEAMASGPVDIVRSTGAEGSEPTDEP